jgi:hypothetical protein
VRFEDLVAYKKESYVSQERALDDLAETAQELGLGY